MKKKWLIAIATSAMAVTVALGISACGKKKGKSDEDIATEALDTLTQVYSTALTETSADFDLLGQVLVDGERYTVTWTATSTVEGIENYVSISQEMNEDKKFHVTISRTTIEVPYTLTASITVGKVTKSENFLRKIPAKSSETSLTATLDLSTKDNRTQFDADNNLQVWQQNGVTLTNSGSVGDFTTPIRLYKNTTVTITMDGAKIIHIDFHSARGYDDNPYPEYLQQSLEASDLPIKGEIAVSEDGLTFSVDFETPLEEVTFKTTAGQCRLTSIDVEGEARDPNEHVHKWSYEHIANTWTHKATCTAEGCDVNTKTEACTPKLNVCECGYTYTAKEIVDALFALEENESLPGTYTLTGVVTAITDPYSDQYKNVTFEMTVEGQTVKAFRVKGTYATEVAVGGTVTVNGELLDYSGTKEFTQGGSVVAFTPAVDERTAQQKVDDALKALAATFTVTKTGETELPTSTVTGVTFAWSTTNQTYTITGNKIKVDALPTADATVTATVTATCGTETVTNNTKTVTITIKAAVTAAAGTAVLDFSGVTESGEGLSNGEVTSEIIGFASANSNLTKVETSCVYKGNGSGGAYPNVGGFLKFGKSDAAGQIKLTFSKNVSSVVINCHDWYKKNDQNPTNSNTVAVNDSATQLMPYNEEATPGDLTFNLATATNVIKIDVNKRGFVFKITVTFADGQQQPELDANQKVDAVKQALNVDLTNFKAVGNTIDLDDAAQNNYGVSVAWAITAPAQGADTYVKIEGNTMSILALPEEETQFTLTATLTLTGATTVTKTFNFTLQPAGQQGPEAGSAQKPFTVLEAVAYGQQNLATSGAQDTKEVYVTGYVIDTGSWKADGYWQYVYIADTATQSKSDTTKVIQVFKLYTDSTYLILSGDLIKGRQITVHGHLKNYTSNNKTTYEFDDYTKDGTPVHPVASSASTLTRDQKLEAAKTAVGSLTNDDVIASFDLPDTVVSGVSYKWSIPQNDYAQVTTEQGKSKVTVTRPAYGTNNQTATLSLTITCDGTEEQPLTWELTIKQKPSTTEESELYILPSAHQNSGSNSSYTSNCDVTYNGVTWNIEGNAQIQPWRFGGKNFTADRKLTGKTAIQGKVSKVLLTLTDGGSITVNSVTLKVYSADPTSGSPVSTKTATYAKGQLITFTADEGEDWSNCYFQIIFNLTVSGSSNKYVAITNLEFRGTGIEE